MCVQVTIYGLKICALLDSGAQRNVLSLHCYNNLPAKARPPIQPSTAEVLQGVGPGSLVVLGEITTPVLIGNHVTNVIFIMADTVENIDVILGHPFLLQAQACLDYGHGKVTLFVKYTPRVVTSSGPEVHLVKVARRTVLEPGFEYIVPGTTHFYPIAAGELMLSPAKSIVKRHHVLVARAVVQARQAAGIPIRVFNPGATPITLKRGTVAGVLQPANVVEEAGPCPSKVTAAPDHVPNHLQTLYAESCANLPEEDHWRLAKLLTSYSDVFSTGPTNLGRTSLVKHDILTTPGPPIKQQPRRMAQDKQVAADQQLQQSLEPSPSSERCHDKGVQCSLTDTPAAEALITIPPEQPLVGVVNTHKSDDHNHTSSHPSINRVSESPQSNLFSGWTHEQMRAAQMTDPDLAPVWRLFEEGVGRPVWTDIAHCSPATKAYWAQWKRLYQRDGTLMRKFYSSDGKVFYLQILLLKAYRTAVMEQMHDGPVGGHFGVERTLVCLQTRYYWHNMKDDVTLWCRTCTKCAAKDCPKKTPQAAMGSVKPGLREGEDAGVLKVVTVASKGL
ncbi:unnamed protein product [Xyrichtys novacula]|uniref:Gypsy retrotransposon integrase-like protein 1 n=1 Tax=Xyrichtys novacula TaxID=13765 RepID=A0AAV1GX83_XYRNO|nr:unnamed protein product [Xyrichtys novacula]